jgi:DNA-directed RNA polymerase specialized sigma24 family protein
MGNNSGNALALVELIRQARMGSQDAFAELRRRLGPFIKHVTGRELTQPLRRLYDSDDFEQTVLMTFFCKAIFQCEFHADGQVLAFLEKLTAYQLFKAGRRHLQSDKRLADRHPDAEGPCAASEVVSHEPDPLDAALAGDLLRHLVEILPPVHRHIVLMRWDGHTSAEIAEELGLGERRVRRMLRGVLEQRGQGVPQAV